MAGLQVLPNTDITLEDLRRALPPPQFLVGGSSGWAYEINSIIEQGGIATFGGGITTVPFNVRLPTQALNVCLTPIDSGLVLRAVGVTLYELTVINAGAAGTAYWRVTGV